MKEFSVGTVKKPVPFKIDGVEFTAIPANMLPADFLVQYFEQVGEGKVFDAHLAFFEFVLEPDSWERFQNGMKSTTQPITIYVMGEVASWLLGEVYMSGKAGGESTE